LRGAVESVDIKRRVGLFALFHRCEIYPDVFGFNMTEKNFAFDDVKIGRTKNNSRRFVNGNCSVASRLQKFLERRAVDTDWIMSLIIVFPGL